MHNTTIIPIPLDRLQPHPENPNKISKQAFEKLKHHIEQSHNYEPLIVREHPEIANHFQIINGHHRAEALRQLGETLADCIVWNVDDDQTRILLATLNRLGGKDELSSKAELVKSLSEKFSSRELAELLPDDRRAIERLKDITKLPLPSANEAKAFLNTLVFFLNDEQLKIVNAAICLVPAAAAGSSKSDKLANAITAISKDYLNHHGGQL